MAKLVLIPLTKELLYKQLWALALITPLHPQLAYTTLLSKLNLPIIVQDSQYLITIIPILLPNYPATPLIVSTHLIKSKEPNTHLSRFTATDFQQKIMNYLSFNLAIREEPRSFQFNQILTLLYRLCAESWLIKPKISK